MEVSPLGHASRSIGCLSAPEFNNRNVPQNESKSIAIPATTLYTAVLAPELKCQRCDASKLIVPVGSCRHCGSSARDVPLKLISGLALLTSVAPKAGGKCTTAARGREATSAVTAGFSQTAAKLGRAMLSPEFCW